MKRFYVLLGILTLSSLAYAQQAPVAAKPVAPMAAMAMNAASDTKLATGIIDMITVADAIKGTKSEIVLVDDSPAKKESFLIKDTTTIYDVNLSALSFDKLSKGQSVKIKYMTTKEGVNEAGSINLIK